MGILMLSACHIWLLLGFEGKVQLLCFGQTFGIVSAFLQIGREGVESSKRIFLGLPQLSSKFSRKYSSQHSAFFPFLNFILISVYFKETNE